MKDYYQILGLEPDATIEEIKAAYKYLAKKFHPDMNLGDTKSKKYFQDIQEAYECLSDGNKRRAYNMAFNGWQEGSSQQPDNGRELAEFQKLLKKVQNIYSYIAIFISGFMGFVVAAKEDEFLEKAGMFFVPALISIGVYLLLYLYFLPSILAYKNCHEYKKEIFILNIFSVFANLLTPLTFVIFYVCLLIYARNKVKGLNALFMAIIGLLFAGMAAKHEREKNKY